MPERKAITLTGGFYCELTLAEGNEWDEYIQNKEEWKERCRLFLQIKSATCCQDVSIEYLRELADKDRINRQKRYQLGKRWYNDVIRKRRENE